MTRVYLKKEETADLIFDAIYHRPAAGHFGVREIGRVAKLTRSQVLYGIRAVKEILAGEYAEPLVYDADLGYRFADTALDAAAYEVLRIRVNLTQIMHLLTGTIEPASAKFKTKLGKRALRHARGIQEDLEELLEELAV